MFNSNLDINKLLSSLWNKFTYPFHLIVRCYKNKKNNKINYMYHWFSGLSEAECALINKLIQTPQHQLLFTHAEDPLNLENAGYEPLSYTFYQNWVQGGAIKIIRRLEEIKLGEYQVYYEYILKFYPHPKKIKIIVIKNEIK